MCRQCVRVRLEICVLLVSITCYHSQKLVPLTARDAELWPFFIHSSAPYILMYSKYKTCLHHVKTTPQMVVLNVATIYKFNSGELNL